MGNIGKKIKVQENIGGYYGKTAADNITDDEISLFLAHQSLKTQRKIESHLHIIKIIMISCLALGILGSVVALFIR